MMDDVVTGLHDLTRKRAGLRDESRASPRKECADSRKWSTTAANRSATARKWLDDLTGGIDRPQDPISATSRSAPTTSRFWSCNLVKMVDDRIFVVV